MHLPRPMLWLPTVIRLVVAPVLLGALALLSQTPHSPNNLAAAVGLVLLSGIHLLFWWRPWSTGQARAIAAAAGMVVINFVLLNLLGVAEQLLWLYPALIAGAGLRLSAALIGAADARLQPHGAQACAATDRLPAIYVADADVIWSVDRTVGAASAIDERATSRACVHP